MPLALLRAYSWLNRFGNLRRAQKAFREITSPMQTERRLFGGRIALDLSRSAAQQLLLLEGERFIEERFLVQQLLCPGMTVVDVGANIGYYLLMFEQVIGPGGRVICVEPSTENLPELRRNIAINRLDNVELHEVAIGATSGTVGLRSGINSGVTAVGSGAYEVPMVTLTRVVGEHRIDFIKIDVEGYESHVLDGAWEIVLRDRPVIFLEVHPFILVRFERSMKEMIDRLRHVYDNLSFFERIPPERESLWHKVGVSYLGRDPLVPVHAQDAYLDYYEGNPDPHTFWVVAKRNIT